MTDVLTPATLVPQTYVDFQLISSPALPNDYRHFEVLGTMVGALVTTFDPNVPAVYNQVLASVADNSLPKDFRNALFLVGTDATGTNRAIAHGWIRPNSISVVQKGNLSLVIKNVDPNQQHQIIAMLNARGYTDLTYTYTKK